MPTALSQSKTVSVIIVIKSRTWPATHQPGTYSDHNAERQVGYLITSLKPGLVAWAMCEIHMRLALT